MSTYYVGDVQGCFSELQTLLKKIRFNPKKDTIGFVGDIVNRGPQSLETLRFIKALPNAHVVLGNHDLFLLIIGYGLIPEDSYEHTLHAILNAPDKMELLEWLREQPLLYVNEKQPSVLVHAGIPPQWSIPEAKAYADEVHNILRGDDFTPYLSTLFGDEPQTWHPNLKGQDRLRYISNALVRMRFCTQSGELEFEMSEKNSHKKGFKPWFEWRREEKTPIYFGHWAALGGECNHKTIHALDTGCAWGHELTAIRVEDHKRFSVKKE